MVVSQSPREQRCPVQSVVNFSLNFVGNTFIRPPPLTFQVALINMEWLVEVAHHGLISYSYFSLSFLSLALCSVLHLCYFACLIEIFWVSSSDALE